MNTIRSVTALPFIVNLPLAILGWIPIIMYLIVLAIMRLYITFDNDEIEAVHTAWKLIHDGVIYRDFFQHHHPLLYYLIKPIVQFFGETLTTLYVARYVQFIFFAGTGYISYLLAKLLWNEQVALLTLYLLYPAAIFQKILEIRPDGAQTFFALLSLLYFFYFLQNRASKHLLISGVLLSVAFLFLQKIIFMILLIGCVGIYLYRSNQLAIYHLILFVAAFIAPLVPYFLYLICTNSWNNYIKFNWLLNVVHPGRFLPVHTLPILLEYSQLLCVGYAFGMIYYLKTEYQKIIGFISAGLLVAAMVIVKFSFSQYYAPAIPLMAMIAAATLFQLTQGKQINLVIIMICIMSGPFMRSSWAAVKHIVQKITNEQHQKLNYILLHTNPDDYIYDGRTFFNLFRHDVHFFWFETRGKKESDLIPVYERMTGDKYNIYAAIDMLKPKIISNYYIDMTHPTVANHYAYTEYNDIWIRKESV